MPAGTHVHNDLTVRDNLYVRSANTLLNDGMTTLTVTVYLGGSIRSLYD